MNTNISGWKRVSQTPWRRGRRRQTWKDNKMNHILAGRGWHDGDVFQTELSTVGCIHHVLPPTCWTQAPPLTRMFRILSHVLWRGPIGSVSRCSLHLWKPNPGKCPDLLRFYVTVDRLLLLTVSSLPFLSSNKVSSTVYWRLSHRCKGRCPFSHWSFWDSRLVGLWDWSCCHLGPDNEALAESRSDLFLLQAQHFYNCCKAWWEL